MMDLAPVVLSGQRVRLEPLMEAHIPALWEAGRNEEIWRWTTSVVRNLEEMGEYVGTALRWETEGTALPFVTRLQDTGRVVGSTRFANLDRANRRVEIGWTWVTAELQRSGVNVEAKYLMLGHAFETLGCIRVEFKTDSLNEKSRRALKALGAVEEGVLRNHMVVWNGRLRHSAYYSVTHEEWPQVKAHLEQRMLRAAPTP